MKIGHFNRRQSAPAECPCVLSEIMMAEVKCNVQSVDPASGTHVYTHAHCATVTGVWQFENLTQRTCIRDSDFLIFPNPGNPQRAIVLFYVLVMYKTIRRRIIARICLYFVNA